MPRYFIALFLLALTGNDQASALDPRKPLTQFKLDVWQIKNDLPHQTIQALLQTRDGYLKLGTHGGLVRFDGVRFVTTDTNETPELRDNRISCLMESRDGAFWIGTDGGGLCRVKANQWSSYTVREGLPHERIKAVLESRDGGLWIGTYGGGLVRFKDGIFTNLTEKNGLADKHVLSLCEDRKGTLWIGTRRGLNQLSSGTLGGYPAEPTLRQAAIPCIYEDRQGQIWIGTYDQGLFRIKDGQSMHYSLQDGLPSERIQSLYQDAEGALWIGTLGGGIARLSHGSISVLSARDGLSDQNILSIGGDREGNLWIGTEDGLNKLSENLFVNYTTREGLAQDSVNTIYQDREGRLWVGNKGGQLNCLRDERWTRYSIRDGLLGTEIGPLSESEDGSLWIGSYSGLVQYHNGKFINRTPLLKYPHVSAIGRTSKGLLVATGMRLNFFIEGRLADQIEIPLNLKYVFEIHEDRQGRLWLATRAGLACRHAGQYKVYTTRDGLASDTVHAIYEDPSGDLWLATSGGLSRFREGRFTSCTTKDGLYDNVLFRVLEDKRNNLWLSCSRGIFRVSKEDLQRHTAGKIGAVRCISYNSGDGLRSAECAGPTQPAGWKAQDGRLWFPTIKGAAVIDPDQTASNSIPPPVVIEKLAVDGNPAAMSETVHLPPGKGNLEFEYTALSFVAPTKVRFRYRLEGYDSEWINAGTRRAAYYSNVPPGEYRFRVIAATNDGVWNEQGAGLGLNLRPHFYQTYWFYALCAAPILFAAHRIYLMRLNRVKAEFAAVIEERNRIAREIHDTLAQGFAGISVQLEAGKQMLLESPRLAEEHLDQANMLARSCLEEVRQYVWNLRHHALGHEGLTARLSELARTVGGGLPFQFKIAGTPQPLAERIEDNLTRIGQEAILNAVKHARASRIEVELRFESKQVMLRIQDDGCGFDPRGAPLSGNGGFGLLGMSERAGQVGGRLGIKSSPGKGTSIEVSVPLEARSTPGAGCGGGDVSSGPYGGMT